LFLRSNGTLVCWDDRGQLKELQAFDPNLDYANQVYLGPVYENIRDRLRKGVMPFPDYCSNCCCLMTHHPSDDGLVRQRTIETFQLEPSMGCQLDCPGCIKKAERSSWVPRTPFGHMTLKPEVVYKIVLDLKAAGIKVKKFDMQGSGEPLLNKKIWEMCGFLAEHYSDSVISICTHANAEFRPDMVMSGVNEILFAIDGVDQESYAPWRVHGNFDRAYRFMHDFSVEAAAKAPHIRRVWKYVLFSHNDTDEQLLRAQQLALDAKITTLRFVVTQLGPASSRVFEGSDIPRLDPSLNIVVDSYRIHLSQLTFSLQDLRTAIREDDLVAAQRWADFLAHSIYRLFNSRPQVAAKHKDLVEAFLESIATLPADRFGKYDWMMAKTMSGISDFLYRQASLDGLFPPLAEAVQIRRYSGMPLPRPPAFSTVSDVRKFVRSVDVDETYYLSQYPDVRAAIAEGVFSSAVEHYRANGYCEGRLPAEPELDAGWYLERYPDIAAEHGNGALPDLVAHFVHYGYREGRSSSPISFPQVDDDDGGVSPGKRYSQLLSVALGRVGVWRGWL
jgi:hypothetical protein